MLANTLYHKRVDTVELSFSLNKQLNLFLKLHPQVIFYDCIFHHHLVVIILQKDFNAELTFEFLFAVFEVNFKKKLTSSRGWNN